MFISVDGIDGAGKSTQLDRLCNWLRNQQHDVVFVRDPGTTAPGEAIRGLLLDSELEMHRRSEALLYMAARAQLVEELIRPALRAGKVVVSDRYLLANVVYQSVGGQFPADTIWQLGAIATDGIYPDLTIILDLPAQVAAERRDGPADRMERRGIEYFESVRQGFIEQSKKAPSDTVIVDASSGIDEVWTCVESKVQAWMKMRA